VVSRLAQESFFVRFLGARLPESPKAYWKGDAAPFSLFHHPERAISVKAEARRKAPFAS
jgi:hypothetical protein